MKRTVLCFLVIIASNYLYSQQKKMTIGGIGFLETHYTRIAGSDGWGLGAESGLLFNKKAYVGTAFRVTTFSGSIDASHRRHFHTAAGFTGSYYFFQEKKYQVALTMFGGAGVLWRYDKADKELDQTGKLHYVLIPGASCSFSLIPYVRIQARMGYRFTGNPSIENYQPDNLNGWTVSLGLSMGD